MFIYLTWCSATVWVGVQVGGIVSGSDVSLISKSCCVTDHLKSELYDMHYNNNDDSS